MISLTDEEIKLRFDINCSNKCKEGTFGKVKIIKSKKYNKLYALKMFHNGFKVVNNRRYINKNTEKEIQVTKSLNHSNVIKFMHSFIWRNKINMLMEYMPMTLYEYLLNREENEMLEEKDISIIMEQILKAVEYLHTIKGRTHLDLKLNNIMIDPQILLVKVIDFGKSQTIIKDLEIDSKGGVVGHSFVHEEVLPKIYKPLEIYINPAVIPQSVDLWCIGCILYQLVFKRHFLPDNISFHERINLLLKYFGPTKNQRFYDKFKREIKEKKIFVHFDKENYLKKYKNENSNRSKDCLDLLFKLLEIDANNRINITDALNHPFIKKYKNKNQDENKNKNKNK